MGMISELLKKLKDSSYVYKVGGYPEASKLFLEAADTIEALSAKLQAANTERSDRYYGGGWITVDENNLPKGEVLGCNGKGGMAVGKIKKVKDGDVRVVDFLGGGLMNCVAYMLLPEPYRP